jgi:hypothetical protein
MNDDREKQIRERAYALWEQEGRPNGEDLRHWVAALEDLASDHPNSEIIAENTSVLGDLEPTPQSNTAGKSQLARKASRPVGVTKQAEGQGSSGKSSRKKPASKITTGEEPARTSVRHTEGP